MNETITHYSLLPRNSLDHTTISAPTIHTRHTPLLPHLRLNSPLQIRVKSLPPLPRLLLHPRTPRDRPIAIQSPQQARKYLFLRERRPAGRRLRRRPVERVRAGEYEGETAGPGEEGGGVCLNGVSCGRSGK